MPSWLAGELAIQTEIPTGGPFTHTPIESTSKERGRGGGFRVCRVLDRLIRGILERAWLGRG